MSNVLNEFVNSGLLTKEAALRVQKNNEMIKSSGFWQETGKFLLDTGKGVLRQSGGPLLGSIVGSAITNTLLSAKDKQDIQKEETEKQRSFLNILKNNPDLKDHPMVGHRFQEIYSISPVIAKTPSVINNILRRTLDTGLTEDDLVKMTQIQNNFRQSTPMRHKSTFMSDMAHNAGQTAAASIIPIANVAIEEGISYLERDHTKPNDSLASTGNNTSANTGSTTSSNNGPETYNHPAFAKQFDSLPKVKPKNPTIKEFVDLLKNNSALRSTTMKALKVYSTNTAEQDLLNHALDNPGVLDTEDLQKYFERKLPTGKTYAEEMIPLLKQIIARDNPSSKPNVSEEPDLNTDMPDYKTTTPGFLDKIKSFFGGSEKKSSFNLSDESKMRILADQFVATDLYLQGMEKNAFLGLEKTPLLQKTLMGLGLAAVFGASRSAAEAGMSYLKTKSMHDKLKKSWNETESNIVKAQNEDDHSITSGIDIKDPKVKNLALKAFNALSEVAPNLASNATMATPFVARVIQQGGDITPDQLKLLSEIQKNMQSSSQYRSPFADSPLAHGFSEGFNFAGGGEFIGQLAGYRGEEGIKSTDTQLHPYS